MFTVYTVFTVSKSSYKTFVMLQQQVVLDLGCKSVLKIWGLAKNKYNTFQLANYFH
jgi:hypothetical protein